MREEKFYNSLSLLLEADYGKLVKLKGKFPSWELAWNSFSGAEKRGHDLEKDWREIEKPGLKLILQESTGYPPPLREIPHAPFGIYVLGNLPGPENLALAIVGTRKATSDGKELAKKFAAELARRGLAIVSGLALGIDAAAHTGCLESDGKTIAVLANGLDSIYPHTNEKLARRILENGGSIISEYPPGSPAYPSRFLERNRIVSGLSRGTLVIEAPENSGSLVTARFALEQNRDIFVVPGPISHPNFKGSNSLIRQGAELVTKPEDILEAYGLAEAPKNRATDVAASPEEKLILSALRSATKPIDVDKIIEITKLEPQIVNQAITFLLMKDLIKESEGGYIID